MSARNRPENKEARRMEREEQVRQEGFKAATQFALYAASSTSSVPPEVLEDAIAYGEALLKPGVSLDDALEIEAALKALRSLIIYRKNLEGAPQVFKVASAGETINGEASIVLNGPDVGAIQVGQRGIFTITFIPEGQETASADVTTSPEQDQRDGDAGPGEEGPDGA